MSNEQIEKCINEVNGSLAIEGLPLTEKDKEDMRAVMRGDISFQEIKRQILADYRPKKYAHE
ncbi:MAG: antitoxin VbhA family protein [Oscillospiraceae bacterium]|nr:antitoxin VbhA family protein [Oscillospiraceae bacterium]